MRGPMFWTAVNDLRSPENAGMIVRSHVAFGGEDIVIIGHEPWRFKKRAQGFSRRLEKLCSFVYLEDEETFFAWCGQHDVTPIAIEIGSPPTFLPDFTFPQRTALLIGNERSGLSAACRNRCQGTVTIPQFGPVGSLNAAVSASIAMYELTRKRPPERAIVDGRYLVADGERPDPSYIP
jgi:23S rRNA (guanosine2251-2'-O)-methyltransferase